MTPIRADFTLTFEEFAEAPKRQRNRKRFLTGPPQRSAWIGCGVIAAMFVVTLILFAIATYVTGMTVTSPSGSATVVSENRSLCSSRGCCRGTSRWAPSGSCWRARASSGGCAAHPAGQSVARLSAVRDRLHRPACNFSRAAAMERSHRVGRPAASPARVAYPGDAGPIGRRVARRTDRLHVGGVHLLQRG